MNQFTIIIPSYNEAEKLDASLSIILDQTKDNNLDCEIIIVDDASTDHTESVALKYFDKIKFYRNNVNSGGAGNPRNTGLENTSTEFVIFYDIGDVLDLSHVKDLINQMQTMEADICVAKHIDIGIDGEITHPLTTVYNGKTYITNLRGTPHLISNPFCWSKIFKTKWIRDNDIKFGNIYCGEDKIFTWTAYLAAEKILISNKILYGHRFFGVNINRMLQRNIKSIKSIIEIDEIMRPRFNGKNFLNLYLARLIKRDIFGIALNENSIATMISNGDIKAGLTLIDEFLVDLFLQTGLKVHASLSEAETSIAMKYLKTFPVLAAADMINEKINSNELLQYNKYITQQVRFYSKY
jgi:glycosyltransferase involved in cell wall biosynthesis